MRTTAWMNDGMGGFPLTLPLRGPLPLPAGARERMAPLPGGERVGVRGNRPIRLMTKVR